MDNNQQTSSRRHRFSLMQQMEELYNPPSPVHNNADWDKMGKELKAMEPADEKDNE